MEEYNNLQDPDWSKDGKALREYYRKTEFDSTFYRLIAKNVIKILSPQKVYEPHNLVYDEDLVYRKLLEPLERFICNLDEKCSHEDIEQKFKLIESLNVPSKICRRILKTGDVTFSCNDCGLDGTCVVCIDCFHKSAHKDHNYRMSNSEGGCCDCGDIEAWKQNYACTDHMAANQANLRLSDFEDKNLRDIQIKEDKKGILEKINRLPEGVAMKYFLVCQASLHYARMLLSWDNFHSVPQCLEVEDDDNDEELKQLLAADSSTKNYFTVLFNDEVHTYDHVINTLVKIIKCSKMTASVMASTVSREGRSLIIQDNFKACKQIKEMIGQVRDAGQGPLKVEVIHGSVLAHQAFALKLIEWVQKMSSICDAFRILTSYTLLGTFDPIPEREEPNRSLLTLIEKIMLSNTTFWKIARIEWNDLFVTSMLTEYSIKERFARLLTRIYPKLMQDFIQDDHDHSVSILTMTTQLYTVPSLICMLIEEENALALISQTLISTCKSRKRENITVSFENRNTFDMQGLKRGFYTIHDLKNLINVQPTKWTDQLRKNVIEAVKIFLDLLDSMQGMDSVRRQLGQHLEYEPDWESGMTLQSRLITFITRLVAYCSFDEEVLVEVLKETQARLSKNGGYKLMTKKLFDHQVTCIHYDVSTSPVSVHLPLTRFAAALIVELMKRRPTNTIPYDESLVMINDNERERDGESSINNRPLTITEIMEPSLRTEVMIAQFRSGMWRRNGYSLVNQIMYFHGAIMRREMFDRDILVLQECAAMIEANDFMVHLLNKFQLFNWLTSETTREPLVAPKATSFANDEEIMAQTMSLGEEFLQLLLTVVGERYRVGVGIIEEEDVIKNEIIQILCISPSTRSDLTQKLYVNDNELDCIKAVANLKRSTEASTGKYELKDEFHDRFNPFFYHYSRRNQSNALDAQLKRKKILKEPLICCPPPRPVQLTKQFSNINQLLKCDITLILIKKILTRALGPPEGSQECSTKAPIRFMASDLQLDQCLHLIGLGLFEQERNPTTFAYIQAARRHDIFDLLNECYHKAKRSKDLIFWLMRKTSILIDDLENNHLDALDESILQVKENFKAALSVCDPMKQDNKKRNSELAAQRRERIMAMMKANQDKFSSNPSTRQLLAETENINNILHDDPDKYEPKVIKPSAKTELCILCRDEQEIELDQQCMVMLAYIQRSAVLSKNRGKRKIPSFPASPSSQPQASNAPEQRTFSFTSDDSSSFDATFMPADLFFGPHISTCGHVMHSTCWQGFFEATMRRETSRPNRNTRHVSFELEKNEILCPLCECISNATIPLMPNYTNFVCENEQPQTIFSSKPEIILNSSENLSAWLLAVKSSVDLYKHIRTIKETSSNLFVKVNTEDKYLRLMQPKKNINEVLEELNELEALGLRDFINSVRCNKISSRVCTTSLLRSITALAERIHSVGLDLDTKITDSSHDRIFMMTTWSISYTIQAFERMSRLKSAPLFEELESSRNKCLTFLLRFACSSMLTHQSDVMQSLLVKKLRYLLVAEDYLTSSICCLDVDAFECFVSVYILLQKLYAHMDNSSSSSSSSIVNMMQCTDDSTTLFPWTTQALNHEYFRNLLHLMLMFNMVQVIISMHNDIQQHVESVPTVADQSMTDDQSEQDVGQADEIRALTSFYHQVIVASGHPRSKMPLINETFAIRVKDRLLPFLRSCAVFFYHLSSIPPPEPLCSKPAAILAAQRKGDPSEALYLKVKKEEFEAVCKYLDLPTDFSLLLRSQEARHLSRAWSRHSRILTLLETPLINQPHTVNRLIDLPCDYSELVDRVSDFGCPSIKNEDSRTPTLCLICGTVLCSQSYCCQRNLNDPTGNSQQNNSSGGINIAASSLNSQQLVGSCTYHAYECSAGVGVFLRIRNCQILLLSGRSKGCYMPAPYIDDHGETDFGLIRGNPLHLNQQHYDKLQAMWITHAIPEQISRTLEYSPYASSINWHLH